MNEKGTVGHWLFSRLFSLEVEAKMPITLISAEKKWEGRHTGELILTGLKIITTSPKLNEGGQNPLLLGPQVIRKSCYLADFHTSLAYA